MKFAILSKGDSKSDALKQKMMSYMKDFDMIQDTEEPDIVISVGGDGTLLLFYKVGPSPRAWWGMLKSSADGGRTWSAEAFLPGAEGRPAAIEVTRFGAIIVYPTSEQAGPNLAFWRSDVAGATWQVVTPRG